MDMLNFTILAKSSESERQLHGSYDSGHCCPPVFNPYTWIALIGGIALATYFLRIVIITDVTGRRRRSFRDSLFTPQLLGKMLFRIVNLLNAIASRQPNDSFFI